MERLTGGVCQIERSAAILRLLVVALAALAVFLAGQPATRGWLLSSAAYVLATVLLWLLAPQLTQRAVVFGVALLDVAATAAIISQIPANPFPLWVLYIFSLASAAAAGGAPAAGFAGVVTVAYLVGVSPDAGAGLPLILWPALVVLAATVLVVVVSSWGLVERREKRAWQEIGAAARSLGRSLDPDEVAKAVVQRVRRLLRADGAWLWWCDDDGQLRPGPCAGAAAELPQHLGALTRLPAGQLERGLTPLTALGEPFTALAGDLILLRHGERRAALLAVVWHKLPANHEARRQRLRVFAPWAADALAQVRAIAATRAALQREEALRRAAASLASTLDAGQAGEIVLAAARAALGGTVSLVHPSSGRLLGGGEVAADGLAQLLFANAPHSTAAGASPAQRPDFSLAETLAPDLALIACRDDRRYDEDEVGWLRELVAVARTALVRCDAHAGLEREERRLRASVEAALAPMIVRDKAGAPLLANAAYRSLGWEDSAAAASLAVGEDIEVVVGDPPRIFVAMTAALADGEHLVSVYREITREREALRAKDELIAMVGHELRTPLSAIHGYSQVMSRQLGVMQRQVGQLNQLIADFMDAARLEGGRLPMVRRPVYLADLARSAAERFRGAYADRSLLLELPDVPPVEGDATRLGQVIDNLLSNAAKYSAPDREIVLALAAERGEVTLSVSDQGVGIAPEHLPHLFERFYRVPTSHTAGVKGLGLGLSIVHDLVIAHGGRVWAESDGLGKGSRFCVSLPVASSDSTATQPGSERPHSPPDDGERPGPDDRPVARNRVTLRLVHGSKSGA